MADYIMYIYIYIYYSSSVERTERALFKLKIPSCYLSKFPGQLHLGLFSIAMDISAAYNFERVPSPFLLSRALAFVESRLIAVFTILSRKSGLLMEREDPAGRGCLFVYDSRSIMNPRCLPSPISGLL